MLFEKLYVPNKLRNKVVKDICLDLIYLRNYYNREELKFFDCSNTNSIKIDLQNSMRIYLNDDQSADIVTYGPGLEQNLSFTKVIHKVILK